LADFEQVKDRDLRKSDRAVVSLRFDPEPPCLKIVAHLYSIAEISRRLVISGNAGPWIRTKDGQKDRASVMFAAGIKASTGEVNRILLITYEEIPAIFANQPSGFVFFGGFDSPQIAFDHGKDTSFLMLLSPPGENAADIVKKFGTVDL
jgi:hypothetical protein